MNNAAFVLTNLLLASSANAIGAAAFSPLSLFAASEPGGFYDFSDLSVMFQDAAGTTPVTAVEQPVGLVLDKSRGLVLGSELVTNGDFSSGTTTGWTAVASSSLSIVNGFLRVTNTTSSFGGAEQSITTVIGRSYKLVFTVGAQTNTSSAWIGTSSGGTQYRDFDGISSGTYALIFTATSTTAYLRFLNRQNVTSNYSDFDNISVRELPGAHLSQSTAAARPVLSARVNLLERTEDLANAYWSKTGIASSSTSGGFTTLTENTLSGLHYIGRNNVTTVPLGTNVTVAAVFKAGTRRYVQFQWDNGTLGVGVVIDTQNWTISNVTGAGTIASSSISALGSGEYRVSVTGSVSSGTTEVRYNVFGLNSSTQSDVSYTANGSTIIVGKVDLRPANAGVGLPAYQRVGAATDYDTTGFPLYLKFDGTDDFLQSSTITPGSVDKAQVFAGVRKLSDAAGAVLVEHSADINTNTGVLGIFAPGVFSGTRSYIFTSKGTSAANAPTDVSAYPAPVTNVVTGLGDIGGDRATVRVDGAQAAQVTTDQGTGNYSAQPLYVGRRGGSVAPFNGHLYQLLVRFSATNLDAATITATETWVNQRTKAF